MNQNYNKLEFFRILILCIIAFLIILAVALTGYLFLTGLISINENNPFWVYLVIFSVMTMLTWLTSRCSLSEDGWLFYLLHFALLFFMFIFFMLAFGDLIFSGHPVYIDGKLAKPLENRGPLIFGLISSITTYISFYLEHKFSVVLKDFIFKNYVEYNHKQDNLEYLLDCVLNAYNTIRPNNKWEEYCYIDDTFSGIHNNKKYKIIECRICHTIGSGNNRNEIIDFWGVLLIVNLNKNIDSEILITKDNYAGYNPELEKFFTPKSFYKTASKIIFRSLADSILIKNNQILYFQTRIKNSFEPSIFCSLKKNIAIAQKINDEIKEMLSLVDILEKSEILK